MSLPFFAIRQISTGHFMPNYGSRKSRGGWTNDEPRSIKNIPPRLFAKKRAAEIALKYWLKGVTNVTWRRVADWSGGADDVEDRDVTPMPHRKADDMEIVAVFLTAWQMTPSGCLTFEVKT